MFNIIYYYNDIILKNHELKLKECIFIIINKSKKKDIEINLNLAIVLYVYI